VITPDEALKRLLALKAAVPIERVPIVNATNRWAAEPVIAQRTQPARDLSAMDGYAVAHGTGPWRVIGESAAGAPFDGPVGRDEAVRIFTGAALPAGTDTVVIQEDAIRTGDLIAAKTTPGHHVRKAGSDFRAGQMLIEAGVRLTPPQIALAVMGGHADLSVRRRIRVALISTGNELVAPGVDAGSDRLPASNAPMLASLIADLPCEVTDLGIIPDDLASLSEVYRNHADYDVMVSTGGASVGDHDLVRPALIAAGAMLDFWKVAMRPGKPLMAGTLGEAIVLGLPGNPVSAFVTATLFLKPLIAHLSGAAHPWPPSMTARLGQPLPAVEIRTDYVRAKWADGAIQPLGGDSGMIVPLAAATALIVRPAGSPAAAAGDDVTVITLA
jgi:molybdopterin molybdotransferase